MGGGGRETGSGSVPFDGKKEGSGCEDPRGKSDSNLGESSAIANGSGSEDFKMPLNPKGVIQSSSLVEVKEQLKTPDRPVPSSSSSGNVAQEVRKRTFQLSPTEETKEDSVDSKRRQEEVSKALVFGSSSPPPPPPSPNLELGFGVLLERRVAARCLFGNSNQEENERFMRSYEERVAANYKQFTQRYIIVDGEDNKGEPCFY